MSLIKSISGIRGTIGASPGENFTPIDVVLYTAAYGQWLKTQKKTENLKVVTGRDARISGPMVHTLVNQTLVSLGIDVVDLGLSTTPTVALSVSWEKAMGGIIITASHNTKEWNALKLLNDKGEFIDAKSGAQVLQIAQNKNIAFATVENLGSIIQKEGAIKQHIETTLALPIIEVEKIRKQRFKVVVDAVNSSGGIAVPQLLEALDIEVVKLHCEPNGHFPHNPEPLKKHLEDLSKEVVAQQADFGIAVDPDVDRLVFMDERGTLFGEEYTLVACADYVLKKTPGPTVSNLSSTRALAEISQRYQQSYFASAVGEVNVVEVMKKSNAVIGGEGNGGVIYPDLHYGRDALVGIVLFLSLLVEKKCTVSQLKEQYPAFYMEKTKVNLPKDIKIDVLMNQMAQLYAKEQINKEDGVKIDFDDSWVHLRKSNTEPIIRIYTEAKTQKEATSLADLFCESLNKLIH